MIRRIWRFVNDTFKLMGNAFEAENRIGHKWRDIGN